MADFPYADWLARSYLKRGENSGHWRDYLQAHGLANSCVSREPTERRCRLVYDIEKSWYKGKHPLSYTQHQELTEKHKQLLEDFRGQTRTEFKELDDIGDSLDADVMFREQNLETLTAFCEKIFRSSQKCSEQFVQVSKKILESSIEVLKRGDVIAPCKFVVVGLGSVAKGEATPYSDLEYAFIVEKADKYFEKLAMDSYFRIGNLQETPLKCFDISELKRDSHSSMLPSKDLTIGYRIDGITERAGNIPTGNGRYGGQPLTLTVQQLIALYKTSAESPFDGLADKSDLFSSSVPIYTNENESDEGTLYREFMEARVVYEQNTVSSDVKVQQKRFDSFAADIAEYTFIPEFVRYQPPSNLNVKVKTDIFRYPTLVANNLKMCLGLNTNQSHETFSILHQQGDLSTENLQYMNIILALSIYIRTTAYLMRKSQIQFIRVAPSIGSLPDTICDVPGNLFVIMGCLLTPIKQMIKSSVDSLKDAGIESLQLSLPSALRNIKVAQRDYLLLAEVLYFTGQYEAAKRALSEVVDKSLESTSCSEFCRVFVHVKKQIHRKRQPSSSITTQPTSQTQVDSHVTTKYTQLATYLLYHTGSYKSALDYFNWMISTQDDQSGFWRLLAAHCNKEIGEFIASKKLLQEVKNVMSQYKSLSEQATATTGPINATASPPRAAMPLSRTTTAVTTMNSMDYGFDTSQHQDISLSYTNIGFLYIDMCEYEMALTYHTKALEMDIAMYGDVTHSCIANHYNVIGVVYQRLDEYNLALEYHSKSLQMWKAIFGADSKNVNIAGSYCNIGEVQRHLGKYKSSLEYHNKSLDMRKAIFGADSNHTKIAASYNNIGVVYELLGEYNSSLEYYTKSLNMRKAIFGAGCNHVDIAGGYSNIGVLHRLLGEYNLSLAYHNKSLDMRKAIFGAHFDHTDIAASYNDIGGAYQFLGEYSSALKYYNKSLDMQKAIFSENSDRVDIAGSYNNIGMVYRLLGEYKTSLEYHNKSLDMRKAVFGAEFYHTDIADSYDNIGEVYRHLGEYNSSLQYHNKSLDMKKIVFGADCNHSCIAASYNNIGEVYELLGEYNSSLAYYNKSLDMLKAVFGADPNHPNVVSTQRNIDTLCSVMDRHV